MKRIRLHFDRRLCSVPKEHKRCWFAIKKCYKSVSDLQHDICTRCIDSLEERQSIYLTLDSYTLLPGEDISLIGDDDIIEVKSTNLPGKAALKNMKRRKNKAAFKSITGEESPVLAICDADTSGNKLDRSDQKQTKEDQQPQNDKVKNDDHLTKSSKHTKDSKDGKRATSDCPASGQKKKKRKCNSSPDIINSSPSCPEKRRSPTTFQPKQSSSAPPPSTPFPGVPANTTPSCGSVSGGAGRHIRFSDDGAVTVSSTNPKPVITAPPPPPGPPPPRTACSPSRLTGQVTGHGNGTPGQRVLLGGKRSIVNTPAWIVSSLSPSAGATDRASFPAPFSAPASAARATGPRVNRANVREMEDDGFSLEDMGKEPLLTFKRPKRKYEVLVSRHSLESGTSGFQSNANSSSTKESHIESSLHHKSGVLRVPIPRNHPLKVGDAVAYQTLSLCEETWTPVVSENPVESVVVSVNGEGASATYTMAPYEIGSRSSAIEGQIPKDKLTSVSWSDIASAWILVDQSNTPQRPDSGRSDNQPHTSSLLDEFAEELERKKNLLQ